MTQTNDSDKWFCSTLRFQAIVLSAYVFLDFLSELLPFLIWTPPPPPSLINFPDFVLQTFQRLLKRIVLFAKL